MKRLTTESGFTIYINPAQVTAVEQLKTTTLTRIYTNMLTVVVKGRHADVAKLLGWTGL